MSQHLTPSKLVAMFVMVATSACASAIRTSGIVSVGPPRLENFSGLGPQITDLMKVCDADAWAHAQPSGVPAFKLRCISGQLQVEIPMCDGWNADFEQRVAVATKARRFTYSIDLPEVGCQSVVMHTNDVGADLAERALDLLGSVLRVPSDTITSVTSETYASAR